MESHADLQETLRILSELRRNGSADPHQLDRLFVIASQKSEVLGAEIALQVGAHLSESPELHIVVRRLAQSTKYLERLFAVVALAARPTADIHTEILGKLLDDKSARVRSLAADQIVSHNIFSLEPKLNAAARNEKNSAAADELRKCHDFLVKHSTVSIYQDLVSVSCRPPGQGSTSSKLFTKTQYESDGAAWIESVLATPK